MLLILSLGLFPLGLVAILASVDSAQQKATERRQEALARLEIKAQLEVEVAIGARRFRKLRERLALEIGDSFQAMFAEYP